MIDAESMKLRFIDLADTANALATVGLAMPVCLRHMNNGWNQKFQLSGDVAEWLKALVC